MNHTKCNAKQPIIIVLLCIVLSACLCVLSGCIFNRDYPYFGEHKELYTTAIYSIPDAIGYMPHGEGAYDPDIYIWEQDNYGRILFSYCEDYGNQVFGLVVCQAFDENNVCFYPDLNYALTLIESEYVYENINDDHLKNKTEAFYFESKEELKKENDWNKPLDKTKCVSYPITDRKVLEEQAKPLSATQCDKILNQYTETLNLPNPSETPHYSNHVLQVDAEGKVLHEIYGSHQHHDNPNWKNTDQYTYYDITLWVITDKDGNYDKENGVMVMFSEENKSDCTFIYEADAILEFKNKNGWINLYCVEEN